MKDFPHLVPSIFAAISAMFYCSFLVVLAIVGWGDTHCEEYIKFLELSVFHI